MTIQWEPPGTVAELIGHSDINAYDLVKTGADMLYGDFR